MVFGVLVVGALVVGASVDAAVGASVVVRGGDGAASTGGGVFEVGDSTFGVGDQLGIGTSGLPTGRAGRAPALDGPCVRPVTEGDAVAGACASSVLVG